MSRHDPPPARMQPDLCHLTPSQVSSVLRACSSVRDRALLAVMYQCGLRRGEVRWLRRQDWSPGTSRNGSLTVWRLKRASGLYPHEIPLWGRTRALLEACLDERTDDAMGLFVSRNGLRPLGPQAVYYVFRNAAMEAGLPAGLSHPHSLRHSVAVHSMNMGADLADIQALLGHASISSTTRYARVLTPRKEDMALRTEGSAFFARF